MKIFIYEFIFRVVNFLKRKLLFQDNTFIQDNIELTLNPADFKEFNLKLPKLYKLRYFVEKDLFQFNMLMLKVGMGFCPISYWKNFIIPGGFLVVEESKTGKIIGAGFAAVHPPSRHREVGTFEWLAVDPSARSYGIGLILASKLTKRLIDENFEKLRLGSQSHRHRVISMHKKMGWKLVTKNK